MTLFTQELTDFVIEFGRERAFANARGVSLGDAEDITQRTRTHARTGSGLAGNRVGRGHIGIGAVVDIEQRTLRAFKQDAGTGAALLVEQQPHGFAERQDALGNRAQLFHDRFMRDFGRTETATKCVVMRQDAIDLGGKRLHVGEIHNADSAAANLVFVSRADATACGADLGAAVGGGVLAHAVQFRMSVALSAIRRFSGVTLTPCASRRPISAISACGSTTTPLPMTASLPGRTTPDGRSESL
jgi:hypothetical protein